MRAVIFVTCFRLSGGLVLRSEHSRGGILDRGVGVFSGCFAYVSHDSTGGRRRRR